MVGLATQKEMVEAGKVSYPSPEVEADSSEAEADKLWVFVYVSDNVEECTRLFRRQESCERFAVEHLFKIYAYAYAYAYMPTGNLE